MLIKRNTIYPHYLNLFLYSLALLFIGEEMGFYFSPFNRVCGSLIFLIYGIRNFNYWKPQHSRESRLNFGLTIILALLTFSAPLSVMSIGFAVCIVLLWDYEVFQLEVLSGAFFFIYSLLKNYYPYFYYLEKSIADGLNNIINFLLSLNINYSATAYGLAYFFIIIVICIFQAVKNNLTPLKKGILIVQPILGYLLLTVLYYLLSIKFLALSRPVGYGLDNYFYYLVKHFFPMNGHLLLFTVLFLVTTICHGFLIEEHSPTKQNKSHWGPQLVVFLLVMIGTFVLGLISANLNYAREANRQAKPRIYIQDTQMDFVTVPNDEVWGVRNGLFGMLSTYLEDLGYQCQLGVDWEKISPPNHDLIMLINPHGKMETGERDQILSFVKEGGCLFILGDHTYMFGLDNDYFALAEELGLAINFDTALYFRLLWKNCLKSPFMTWDILLKREDFLSGIVQGASLTPKYPAEPLIIGAYGWSDSGDLENKSGYLGNRIYEAHELTGDVVLAAIRNYGKGKVMVFGDTSFLQNSPLSSAYPLLQLCLSQLEPKNVKGIQLAIPLAFLLSGLIIGGVKINKNVKMAILLVLLTSMIGISYLIGGGQSYIQLPSKTDQVRAGINRSFFPSYFDNDWGRMSRGMGGLKNTIIREKILPYELYITGANLDNTDLLFLLAPQAKLPSNEVQNLLNYIKKGGFLILAAGYEHKTQVQELCAELGVEILNTPYSYLAGEQTNLGIRFVSAWPLKMLTAREHKVICETWDKKPLVIEIPEGKGKAIIIGDSYFFENRNLEENELYYKNNMDFVRNLLSAFREQTMLLD